MKQTFFTRLKPGKAPAFRPGMKGDPDDRRRSRHSYERSPRTGSPTGSPEANPKGVPRMPRPLGRGGFTRWATVAAATLFSLQLVHLFWLTTDVVGPRLLGEAGVFDAHPLARLLLALVDYTEIPALLFTTLVYLRSFAATRKPRDLFFLALVNLQWFHLFWITDTFIIQAFTGAPRASALPATIAWLAIAIDYLEAPVIVETLRRAVAAGRADQTRKTRTASSHRGA